MLIPKICAMLIIPVYAYHLSPAEQGIYAITLSITTVMSIGSAMGLNAYYLRFYGEAHDKGEFNGTIYWFLVIWNFFFSFIVYFGGERIWKLFEKSIPYYPYMFFAVAAQFFNSLEIIPMRTFRVKGESIYYLLLVFVKTVLIYGCGLYFVIYKNTGIMGRYYSDLIASFITGMIFIIYMLKNSKWKIRRIRLISALKFSLPIMPADLTQVSEPMIMNIIINKMLSLSQVGVYSLGTSVSSAIGMVTQSISLSLEPEIYGRTGDIEYPLFCKKIKNYMMVIGGFFCFGCGLFIRELTLLFLPQEYWGIWKIVQVLSIGYLVSVLKGQIVNLIIVENKTHVLFPSNLMGLATEVVFTCILIKFLGEGGLGWAVFSGQLFVVGLLYNQIDKRKYNRYYIKKDIIYIMAVLLLLFISRVIHNISFTYCITLKIILLSCVIYASVRYYGLDFRNIIIKK